MRSSFLLTALLFALPTHAVTFDWVTVGDPGNAPDTEVMLCCGDSTGTTGYGSVGYVYRISKYEVTNAQYAEFLNSVAKADTYALYDTSMGSTYGGIARSGLSGIYTYSAIAGREDMPVNWVSLPDAMRFANWLHNGQPTGAQDGTTTEAGAYNFWFPWMVPVREVGATVFVPSEDEWYKAAYYDPVSSSYFDLPAGTDTIITCAVPGATPNTANCSSAVGDYTDVGSYTGSASPNGTFDQGGNVYEWNEAIVGEFRSLRGSAAGSDAYDLAAYHRWAHYSSRQTSYIGFRVGSVPTVPVPVCDDDLDNDFDGLVDYPLDPGCENTSDDKETDETGVYLCDDGIDNDGDGLDDYPDDPGCDDPWDTSERSDALPCDNGLDDDGDERIDFDPVTFAYPGHQHDLPAGTGDPGCKNPSYFTESPQCQDGIDNWDNDFPLKDYDAGLSANGSAGAGPDPQCIDKPWRNNEGKPAACGLGIELALLMPPLILLTWRCRRRSPGIH